MSGPAGGIRPLIAIPLMLGAGALAATAFAPLQWWPAAFIAAFIVVVCADGQGFWQGFGLGLCYGITFFAILVGWLTMYLGPIPWMALSLLMGTFCAFGIAIAAIISKRMAGRSPLLVATVFGLVLSGREALTNVFPYGGFGWGRIGVSQGSGPLMQLSAWLGITGLTFVVVWISAALAISAKRWLQSVDKRFVRSKFLPIVVALCTFAIACAVPSFAAVRSGNPQSMTVAAVQGNANAGLMSNSAPGTFLRHQLVATAPLIGKHFDVLLWPENASDLDPFVDVSARNAISKVVTASRAPLVFGTLTTRGEELFNSSVLWDGRGARYVYDKRRPVPFAEYMPNRRFFHALAPDLVNLISRNYEFGTRSPIINVDGHKVGLMICFESSIDDLVALNSDSGAEALFVQSNNADFGHSSEAAQQFEITRMQAVVAAKSIVNISTVASSAVVSPTGKVTNQLPDFQPGHFIATIQLHQGMSPGVLASQLAPWIMWLGTLTTLVITVVIPRVKRN